MSDKETRTVKINGQKYHLVGKRESHKNIASVYSKETTTNKNTLMAKKKSMKKKWAGLKDRENYVSLPELMQKALTEAVESVEKEREQSEKIDEAVENIKETYER